MRMFFLISMLLILVAGCQDNSSAPMVPLDGAPDQISEKMADYDKVVTPILPTRPEMTWFSAVPSHSRYGEMIKMVARVSETGIRGDSPGEVAFFDGETHLATVLIDPEDGAIFETSALEPCRHLLSARYVGIDSVGGMYVSEKYFVVVVTDDTEKHRRRGYWLHQCSGSSNAEIDIETMECYLSIVGEVSEVFGEIHDFRTLSSMHEVLFMGGNKGSALERFDRELLVAWLNYANGSFGFGELLTTSRDGTQKLPFFFLMMLVESVRLKPDITETEVKDVTRILQHIINMAAPTTDSMR